MDPGNMLKQSQKQGRKRKQSARFQWVDTKGATASHVCGTARHGTAHVVRWCRQQLPSLLGKLWFAHRTILFTLGLYANHSRGKYIFKGILYVGNEEEIYSKSKPARKIVSLASDKETLLRQHLLSCQHQNRLVIIQGKKKGLYRFTAMALKLL